MKSIEEQLIEAKSDNAYLRDFITTLRCEIEDKDEQIAEYEKSFQLRWDASMRAIKRWQAANPGKELIWPDHTDLCVWLMDQIHLKTK